MKKQNKYKTTLDVRKGSDMETEEIYLPSEATFQKFGKLWLEAIHIDTKESTFVKYYNCFYNHILPELGEILIPEFSARQLQAFAFQKLQSGRLDGNGGLSAKTVKDLISVIREIIKFAQSKEITVFANFDNVYIKAQKKPLELVSPIEQIKLEQYLMSNINPKNLGILICLYMGLRIGELCALKWEDIRLDEGILYIRHTLQRIQKLSKENNTKTKVIITSPKSAASYRHIPIPDFILELLKTLEIPSPDTFFLTGKPEVFVEPRSYQYYYRKILEQNEIKYTNFHVLRHTFATRCVENGFDIKALSEILGHSSVNITLNKYVHSSMEMKRKNMSKIHLISISSQP